MASLIERYVSEVTRRLPEGEREEVRRELSSNIYDMLSDNPQEEEIAGVLNGLGSPSLLASQYSQKQRYLISPAYYSDYVRVLKWIVPLVGCVLLAVGLIFGALETMEKDRVDVVSLAINLVSQGLSFGIAGVFNALVWTTIGFVIAERTGMRTDTSKASWTVADLPETIQDDSAAIPLSDSIVELVLVTVFSVAFVLFCLDIIPIPLVLKSEHVGIVHLLSSSFLAVLVPVIIISGVLNAVECLLKIIKRRWTPVVCVGVVVGNVVAMGLFVFLALQPQIFAPEFVSFAQGEGWWDITALTIGSQSFSLTVGALLVSLIVAVVVIASVAECISVIRKTIRASDSAA